MMNLVLAMAYGVVGIACILMVIVWTRIALEDPPFGKDEPDDRKRYRLVAWGLSAASSGIVVLCANRIGRAMFDSDGLDPWLLVLAAVFLLYGKLCLIRATAIGSNDKSTLRLFAALGTLWCASVVVVMI